MLQCSWPRRTFPSFAERPISIEKEHCTEVLGGPPSPAARVTVFTFGWILVGLAAR